MQKRYNCPDCKVKEDSCDGCQRYCDSVVSNRNDINTQTPSLWDYLKETTVSEYDFPKVNDYENWKINDYNKITNYCTPNYGCCENCSNNPKNNPMASGICNCALPYMTTTGGGPRW